MIVKTTLNKQIETAKKHNRNKDYNLAIDILNCIDISNISDTFLGDYYLLQSECSIRLGRFDHDYPEKAVALYKLTNEHEKFGLAKFLRGWQLQSLGESLSAKSELIEAYASAIRADNSLLACQSLSILSYILVKEGSIEQAEENLKKSMHLFIEAGKISQSVIVKNNLTRLYISCGRFKEAIKTLEKNFAEIEKDNDTYLNAILSLSLSYALQGDRQKALKLIRSKGNEFSESQRQQSIYHEYHGQILMLDGQLKESLSQLHTGLELSLKMAPESDMISQIERLLGDAYLLLGDYKKSKLHTTKALQVAKKINERIEIAACYRIFAQLEYRKGNNDKAKDYFTKSIELFNLISSYYELAVTQFITAKSYLFSDHNTLEMLYEARKYFKSENISHYLKEVDGGISRLKNISVETSSKLASNINECPIIITADKTMRNLLSLTKDISVAHDTVLITGDTGTGKELLAHYIHYHSGHTGKFITVNSATIPESIFESELFGYDKGAFTGANKTKKGKFELAENGTLFLDEIGEIPLLLQAKLLRVLEENKVERLGSVEKLPLNVRVIAATNKDLQSLVDENKFRPDLYYRLKVLTLNLPPLRDRTGDIPALVEYFLHQSGHKINGDAKIVEQLATKLSAHQWNGNIRELRNELKRLYLFADKSIHKMIELVIINQPQSKNEQLLNLLEETNWNRRETARKLGVSEGTIRKRILKYNLSEQSKL